MDDLLVFLALLVGGAALIIPVIALVFAIMARKRSLQAEAAVRGFDSKLDYLEQWIKNLAQEVDRMRRAEQARPVERTVTPAPATSAQAAATPASVTSVETAAPVALAATTSTPAAAPAATPPGVAAQAPAAGVVAEQAAPGVATEPAAPPPAVPSEPIAQPGAGAGLSRPWLDANAPPPGKPTAKPGFDFEGLIGVRLFAVLGGGVMFIAAALFLQYSIEHELISPAARVAIGLLAGTAFLLGGDMLRKKADRPGQALSGAGLGILYASLFAARALYDLLPASVTFVGMALVTAVAGAFAVRRGAYVLAVLGLVGGFATPIMLSTGENRPIALFAYVAMLDIGVVFVALKRRWHSLLLVASVGSTVLFAGWAAKYLDQTSSSIPLLVAVVLGAIFLVPSLLGAGGDSVAGAAAGSMRAPLTLWERAVAGLGATLPFFAALAVASSSQIDLAPGALVGYLLILSLGATFVSYRADLAWLPVAAPPLVLLVLVARVDQSLFPAHRLTTLAWLAVPPFFALALAAAVTHRWFDRWLPPGAKTERAVVANRAARVAAGVALALAPLLVVRILSVDSSYDPDANERSLAPVVPLAVFGALHWLGLVGLAAATGAIGWLAAANGVSLLILGILASRYETAFTTPFAAITIAPMLALWAAPIVLDKLRRDPRAAALSGIALALHFPLLYGFSRESWPAPALAAVAIGCAVLSLVALRLSLATSTATAGIATASPATASTVGSAGAEGATPPVRAGGLPMPNPGITALLGAVTLGFLTASVPIALENQWITVAWGAEAAALAWLRRKVPHDGLVWGCAGLAAAAFVRLVANPWLWEYESGTGLIVLNWLLYTFGIPIVSFFAAAYWLEGSTLAGKLRLRGILQTAAGVLAFVLLNAEIADGFGGGSVRSFRLSGDSLLEDMTYSLGWGVFALVTLVVGITRKSRGARAAALGVLVLTFGKVFLHDLSQLEGLYKVGSMLGLAVALLVVAYLMQRFVLRKSDSGEAA